MRKALMLLIILLTFPVSASYAILTYLNNRDTPWPDRARIQTAFDAAAGWIRVNQEKILRDGNPALWWMVQRSAALTGDPDLQAAFGQYQRNYLETTRNLWRPLFYPGHWVPFKNEDIALYSDYQQHFVYAISCDPELAEQPIIRAQLDSAYCDRHPLRPACATHQLMGFRFMLQNHCGDPQAIQRAAADLQRRIARQLTWDPRVVDVYIQRVLMLVESGAAATVKPVWLQQVLNAQRPDGGWGGFYPLLPLPGGNSLGFNARSPVIAKTTSDFHATAQGLLLTSLLLSTASPQQ